MDTDGGRDTALNGATLKTPSGELNHEWRRMGKGYNVKWLQRYKKTEAVSLNHEFV